VDFDFDAARRDGISDDDIATYLAPKLGFDLQAARNDGVPTSDIIAGFQKKLNPDRSWSEFGSDLAKDFTKGALSVAGGIGWLARKGIVDPLGRAVEGDNYVPNTDFEQAATGTSDEITARESAKRQKQIVDLGQKDGFFETLGYLAENPTALLSTISESAAGTALAGGVGAGVARGVFGRVVGSEAAAAANPALVELAQKAAERGAKWAAGSTEALQTLGSVGEQIEQKLDEKGVKDPQARADAMRQAIPAALSTLLFSLAGGGVEAKLFAGKALASGKDGLAKTVAKDAFKEGVLEEFPQSGAEQAFQNLGENEGGLGTDITKGVGQSAALGLASGAAMGGAAGGFHQIATREPTASEVPVDRLHPDHAIEALAKAPVTPVAPAPTKFRATPAETPEKAPAPVVTSEPGGILPSDIVRESDQQPFGSETAAKLYAERAGHTEHDVVPVRQGDTEAYVLRPRQSSPGIADAFKGMGKAISSNLYDGLYKALESGSDTFAGVKDPVLARARPAFEAGQIKSADDLRKFVAADIDKAANEAATSPKNGLAEPTEAQQDAGNYQKGHVTHPRPRHLHREPAGSTRSGVDGSGKEWSVDMAHHYGYIKGTIGRDKDHVDVFVGRTPRARRSTSSIR
jgi:hypothetical protein